MTRENNPFQMLYLLRLPKKSASGWLLVSLKGRGISEQCHLGGNHDLETQ